MNKKIIKAAESYQDIDRQIKDLQAKQKKHKDALLDYAKENKEDFDEAFQLKFPNGTYIVQRVKDVVEGEKMAKTRFLDETEDEYAKIELDEKSVIEDAANNKKLRKLLAKLGLEIVQKETFAIYAG